MVNDPVCGMLIDEKKAGAQTTYNGRTYYFCSDDCLKKFQEDPKKYATQPVTAW